MLTEMRPSAPTTARISIRQLRETDFDVADRILRDAFDRFTGVNDLFGSRDYVRSRWRARPRSAIAAEVAGALAGSNFVTDWGSIGFFGPLSVRPDLWDRGVGKALMESTLDLLSAVGIRQAGLFTFPQSAKHVGLYQRFGFWPQHLTCILSKPLDAPINSAGSRYADLASDEKEAALRSCRELTAILSDGLDLSGEIQAVSAHKLGDTLLLWGEAGLDGFAICHAGRGSEAGAERCYVKFAAVHPKAAKSDSIFARLVDACEAFGGELGARSVEIGVNTACHEAYRQLIDRHYRADLQGVAMTRPNSAVYHRRGLYVLDDWR